jgi:hypothetical protein
VGVIYLYAVLGAGAHVPRLCGLDDAPVRRYDAAGLALAVSEHGAQPRPSDEAVLRHAEVVEALAHAGGVVLPARFGLAFDGEQSLEEAVGAKAKELRVALERVRGCAEVGLRVLRPDREQGRPAARGAAYLRARLQEATEREGLAEELHAAVAAHARDSTRHPSAGGRLVLSGSYLVPADAVEAFRREVGRLERAHPELALLCTGPWPPYSFAPPAQEGR